MPRDSAALAGVLLVAVLPWHAVGQSVGVGEGLDPQQREAAGLAGTDQPSGLAILAAVEEAVVGAVAQAEASVVSIGRVAAEDAELARRDGMPLFGMQQLGSQVPDPMDPDYVFNEYGTGVVISESGLVLTNYHVVRQDARHYLTTARRKRFLARIKAADPRYDLAVLEAVEPPVRADDFTPIKFGDASQLRKGQFVIALGNPYAIARDGQASATWGIVANLQRKAPPGPERLETGQLAKDTLHHFGTLIQTDARLNLGTSGGALINLQGEMIGLTTSLAAVSGYEQAAGYAIPVDETFKRIVARLCEGMPAEYGLLGIYPANLEPRELAAGLRGVRVNGVWSGGPADAAGVRDGDLIVTVAGEPVYDADGLMLRVGRLAPGSTTTVEVVHADGRRVELRVKLAKFAVRGEAIETAPRPAWRGLLVDYATAVLGGPRLFGGPPPLHAPVAVSAVEPDSPAWQAGLRPGTMISHVFDTRIEEPQAFYQQVSGREGVVRLKLVEADGTRRVVDLPPD
jgi:serine protease Do